jgi:transposase
MLVTEPVRRFEVFTGAGHRRRWSDAEKASIVAESYGGVESVCAVARRHGLASTQLFTWRKEARDRASAFVPVLMEEPARAPKPRRTRRRRGGGSAGEIELEFDGVRVRVGRGADLGTLETLLRVLKAER